MNFELAFNSKKIGFENVIGMIDEMIVTLKQEQTDDNSKIEYCETQFDQTEVTRPNLQCGTYVFKTNVPEAPPHDQLRKYGGRIHDLREITRPNLQCGTCVFKTNVPEALPHDQLREYGGRIHAVRNLRLQDQRAGGNPARSTTTRLARSPSRASTEPLR